MWETLGAAVGLGSLGRFANRRRTLVLAYHNVVPDDAPREGERSLHLSRSRFVEQLQFLETHYRVVPLADLLRGERRVAAERPPVAITFDDAYRGALEIALPELGRRGLAATVFAAPALLGRDSFWWDALATPDTGTVPPAIRAEALERERGCEQSVRAWARRSGFTVRRVGEWLRPGTVRELDRAVAEPGVTVGSHTWSHRNLRRLDEAAQREELGRSREWLRVRYADRFSPWIAYPYGLATERTSELAAECGYAGGVVVGGGLVSVDRTHPLRVPRLNVPAGMSVEGLELRAAGLPGL